ncbi:MAG: M56 family metallopeptidase [Planctomycetota bacterium]
MTSQHEIVGLFATHLWQLTLLIVVVGLVTRLFGTRYPRAAHSLWLLVILKAIIPPVVASPTGLFSWSPAASVQSTEEGLALGFDSAAPSQVAVAEPSALGAWLGLQANPWLVALLMVWAVGVFAVFACWLTRRHSLLHNLESHAAEPSEGLLEEIRLVASRCGLKHAPRVLLTDENHGPATMGIFRKRLILPTRLSEVARGEELRSIITHELLHIRRGDTLLSLLQVLAVALCWFHPLVWWASRQATDAAERCVDDDVVATAGCSAVDYASALIRVLEMRCRLRPMSGVVGVQHGDITVSRLNTILRSGAKKRLGGGLTPSLAFVCLAALVLPGQTLDSVRPSFCHFTKGGEQSSATAQPPVLVNSDLNGRQQG